MARVPEETKQLWKQRVLEQRSSGLSIAAWCRCHQIPAWHFHYWQGKLFPKAILDRSSFTELEPGDRSARRNMILEYKEFSIHLGDAFDSHALKQCLDVIKQC